MKILLTGASGLVGGAFAAHAGAAGHEVIGIVGKWKGAIPGLRETVTADLCSLTAVGELVDRLRPDAIVNAAAVSEPAQCDADPELSHCLNVGLPESLARKARENGARFIHLSSEQVFDGTKPPYSTADPVNAINLYARQKIESEERVRAADAVAATLRLPLLMGNSPSGRRSLHERLLALWAAGREAKLYVDEIRQVCTGESVARAMLEVCGRPELHGVFHWAGEEPASRHELGVRVRERFNLTEKEAPIVAVERRADPAAAAVRQADLTLDLLPLSGKLREKPQTLAEALAELKLPDWWTRR